MDKDVQPHRAQLRPEDSPWSRATRIRLAMWTVVWPLFCAWTPKPFNRWRLFVIRLFGATISGTPFIHPRARIAMPWNVRLEDRACIGDRTNLYSLATITVREQAIVAQEAYLCTGDHDLSDPAKPLITAPIEVGRNAFVGARTFVLSGVTIGDGATIGACSVVTSDVGADRLFLGQPARDAGPSPGSRS